MIVINLSCCLQPKDNVTPRVTKFLSLDKCLPHREFLQVREHLCYIHSAASSSNMLVCLLQIVDVQERPGSSDGLEYDLEWLAILKATNSLQRTTPYPWNPPENNGLHKRYTDILTELRATHSIDLL